MKFEELLAQVEDAGFSEQARFAIEEPQGGVVFVNSVDVERGDVSFIRFFRSDDIPGFLGAPGPRFAAESPEDAASVKQARDHATMRVGNPWYYPCRMSVPGSWSWHGLEVADMYEQDGYEVVLLADAGEEHDLLF